MSPDAVKTTAQMRGSPAAVGPVRAAFRAGELREASRRLGEPAWLGQWREHAGEIYSAAPLPIRADHLWRYTDPAAFELPPESQSDGRRPPNEPPSGSAAWMSGATEALRSGEISGAVLSADGGWVRSDLSEELTRAGVVVMDLKRAAHERPDLIVRVLGSLAGPDFGKFEALNAATFQGGVFLYVPRDRVVDKPIHLLEWFSRPGFTATRLLILAEEGSAFTLISELSSDAPHSGQISGVAECELGAGTRVQFATIQTLSDQAGVMWTQRARVGRGASFVPVLASFGGALSKVDAGTILAGENAESEMTGFVSAVGRQRFDHHTLVHHLGRHTRSNLDFKTVLADKARSAYTGLIRIEPSAPFSEAYQENRNLLLSDHCRADSIPELEILTEEVQCKHGATAGPIDPEHLFYLMSRAIPKDEAVRTIVEGHFEPTLQRLPAALQERLRSLLRSRLR